MASTTLFKRLDPELNPILEWTRQGDENLLTILLPLRVCNVSKCVRMKPNLCYFNLSLISLVFKLCYCCT